jgi:hypothetical protein
MPRILFLTIRSGVIVFIHPARAARLPDGVFKAQMAA